jgi:hypothetical protein
VVPLEDTKRGTITELQIPHAQACASTSIINYAPNMLMHAGVPDNAAATSLSSMVGFSKARLRMTSWLCHVTSHCASGSAACPILRELAMRMSV